MLTIKDFIPLEEEIRGMVIHLGSNSVHDAVQDVFVKLLEIERKEGNLNRIEYNGMPNKSYVYLIARSVVVTEQREAAKDEKRNKAFLQSIEAREDIDYAMDREEMLDTFAEAFEKIHYFSKKVYEAYVLDDHSINSLSKATGIGKQTIRNEIKYVREQIKNG